MISGGEGGKGGVGRAELPRVRRELEGTAQIFEHEPYWVIKDPLSLRYYRFSREEYFIFARLQKGVTLEELKESHLQEFRGAPLTNQEIGEFVRMLGGKNLLVMRSPDRDEVLFRNAKRVRRAKWKAQIGNFMFFKIPVYDPDKLFNRVIDRVRFIWTQQFFMFYLALLGVALLLVIKRWNDFSFMFSSQFFTVYNLPMLLISVYFIKALHELGHGLTCKNYGGEVHEMGWLFLVFTPFLYCNVTDSWTFADKRRRILVTAGGIMTELFFAALAAIVWYLTEPPSFIHTLMFNVVIACSLSTVLFNANPLLRYDGYYMLMDLIEVPNLRQRSSLYMRNCFVRYILGGRAGGVSMPENFRSVFRLYSVAAYFYRWFIMFVILYFVYTMLKEARLVWLGRAVVMVSAMTMLIIPMWRTGAMLTQQRRALGVTNSRLVMLLAVAVLAGAGVLFWPLDQQVTLNFIVEPVRVHWMRSEAPGKLRWQEAVHEGVWIEASGPGSQVVAELENPELLYEAKKLAAQIEQVKLDIDRYQQMRVPDTLLEQGRKRLDTLKKTQGRLDELISHLEVKAPFTGEVLSADVELTALSERYIHRGAPLFLLGDTRELIAKVFVSEKDYARIFHEPDQLGQGAELMLYAFSAEKFSGRVTAVSSQRQETMGEFGEKMALSNKVGGEVLTEYDAMTDQEKPVEPVYELTIKVDGGSAPAAMRAYMSGRVHIDCGKSTLYQWGRDSLLRFISPEMWL